jgi:histidyl-tRNA synthetase
LLRGFPRLIFFFLHTPLHRRLFAAPLLLPHLLLRLHPLAQQLRRSTAGLRVLAGLGARSLKAQMRAANRAGARWTLIIGDSELAAGTVVCKNMAASQQESVPREAVLDWLVTAARA